MAVTKIHPIKSTLKKALDYIENPAKTDEKMLVSSFACSYETADIEFELLLSQAMQKGNNLLRREKPRRSRPTRLADSLQMKCCKENTRMY